MDLSLFSILSFASLFFLLISFSIFKKNPKLTLPPGKTGLPIIGETLEYLSRGRNAQPELFFSKRMAKFSPLAFKTSLFGSPMIVLCGAQGNKFLFSNTNKLVKVWFPKSIIKIFNFSEQSSTSEKLIEARKHILQFLRAEALQCYIGVMDSIVQEELHANWQNKHEVTVFPLAKMLTFRIASRLFINLEDPKDSVKFFKPFELIALGMFSIPLDFPGTAFNRGIKASKLVRKELLGIIKQRKVDLAMNRGSPPKDILSHMLLTPDKDGKYMDETNITDRIIGVLLGGHDSTTSAITSLMKYLAELPEVYNEVLKEQMQIAKSKIAGDLLNWNDIQKMSYTWNVVCEVLRLTPPLLGAFREAIADFSYTGFSIPKGTMLHWSPQTTHKNPKCFPDPEKFDPSRFDGSGPAPYTYVPFGGGPRMCPGKEYARLEILVFVHNLVKNYRWEKVLPDERMILNPLPVPENGLRVRLFPRDLSKI